MDSRIKYQTYGILCKFDIEKAYNHVNWNFLLKVVKDMGFGMKCIRWIAFCIRSNFLFWVSVSPEGFFSSERGLRQRDSLSPFLFLIAMEGLNQILKLQKKWESLEGFQGYKRGEHRYRDHPFTLHE